VPRRVVQVGNRFPIVQEVPVQTRSLIVWNLFEGGGYALGTEVERGDDFKIEGSIVWLQTEEGVTQEEIRHWEQKFKTEGAVRVKVLPPKVVTTPLPQAARMAPVRPHATIRSVVEELTKALPKDVLDGARGIIEGCLVKSGL
jgi:restriction endonuclease Mrr